MRRELLVRIYKKPMPGAEDTDVEIGTGYCIAPDLIITARHVLADQGQQIEPERLDITWYYIESSPGKRLRPKPDALAQVWWDGEDEWDLVLLKVPFPEQVPFRRVPWLYADPSVNSRWEGAGFPRAGKQSATLRPATPLKGTTFRRLDDKRQHLDVDASCVTAEDWKGVSGAPVFTDPSGNLFAVITQAPQNFSGGLLIATPLVPLRRDNDEFRSKVGLLRPSNRPPIDPEPFKKEIVRLLLETRETIARIEAIFEEPGLDEAKLPPFSGEHQPATEEARALRLANTLIHDLPFPIALELLARAVIACQPKEDAAARECIFNLIVWFAPAAFDLDISNDVAEAYRSGNVALIETHLATSVAAEIVLAGAALRPAFLGLDKQPSPYQIPSPGSPVPLEQDRVDLMIGAIESYLVDKEGAGRGRTGQKPTEGLKRKLQREAERPTGAKILYLVFGDDDFSNNLTIEERRRLAEAVKGQYPMLVVISLDPTDSSWSREDESIPTLADILKRG
ncbi:MAG: trypsin-like serine peptidase [Alphaproteobacteria bacterium]